MTGGLRRWPLLTGVLAGVLALAGLGLVGVSPAGAAVFTSDVPAQSWRVNGRVYATAIVGDTVYLGGTFTAATSPSGTSVPRKNLAAFTLSTGELVTGWRADAGAAVRAMVSDGTSLYVGGAFGTVGGVPAGRVAKLDLTTGAADRAFSATRTGTTRALALGGGRLFAGGALPAVGSVTRGWVASLDKATGVASTTFNPSADAVVMGVAAPPAGDVVYVSGSFTTLAGVARNGVGAVRASDGATTATVFRSAARPTLGLTMSPDGSQLFGAGGSGSNSAAAWNPSTGTRTWRVVTDGDIQAIAYHAGTVYFGFHDGFEGDPTVKLLAADAATGLLEPFRPHFDGFWGVFSIAVSDGGVIAGGEFDAVAGVPAVNVARFLPGGTPPPAPNQVRYVSSTTSWRYWDQGTRPAGWQTTGFNASAWPRGLPQLGYGDGDEATIVSFGPDATSKYITTYFRTSFPIAAGDPLPTSLELQVLADDGAVVYLNGVEVARDDMPTGTIDNATLALTDRNGGLENALRPFAIDPARLRVGSNVIAVEVHNFRAANPDLGFDADLTGTLP